MIFLFFYCLVMCTALNDKATGDCLGVVVVYDKRGAFGSVASFTEEDNVLLEAIAPVLGAVIDGAKQGHSGEIASKFMVAHGKA
jgi:hypothetical protein